jgi:hypothetical protein
VDVTTGEHEVGELVGHGSTMAHRARSPVHGPPRGTATAKIGRWQLST